MAEREGFEPSLEFLLNTLSKRAPSTTRPSLQPFYFTSFCGGSWFALQNLVSKPQEAFDWQGGFAFAIGAWLG